MPGMKPDMDTKTGMKPDVDMDTPGVKMEVDTGKTCAETDVEMDVTLEDEKGEGSESGQTLIPKP
jgi:hypothetical protein